MNLSLTKGTGRQPCRYTSMSQLTSGSWVLPSARLDRCGVKTMFYLHNYSTCLLNLHEDFIFERNCNRIDHPEA